MKLVKTETFHFAGRVSVDSPSSWTIHAGNLEGEFREVQEVYEDENWDQTIITSLLTKDNQLLAQHTAHKPW